VAVGAARRLHCDAHAAVAPQNSLRELRSLRSNTRGESVYEARWRAPTPALRFSSPQKSPPPGAACREGHQPWCTGASHNSVLPQPQAGAGCGPLAASSSAGARGLRIAPSDSPSGACLSSEHRQLAQRDASHARASSARALGHRAAQSSRPQADRRGRAVDGAGLRLRSNRCTPRTEAGPRAAAPRPAFHASWDGQRPVEQLT